MSKATALPEIAALAAKAGFEEQYRGSAVLACWSADRVEGFQLICEGEAFDDALWFARTEFITVVDKRSPGEFGDRSGVSLGATAKRRAVGMGDVRAEMRTSVNGLPVGYLELKRRIKNENWRES